MTEAVLTSPARSSTPAGALLPSCAHCGLPAPPGQRFCCPGCGAAFALIEELGLGRYYQECALGPGSRAPRPELGPDGAGARPDLGRHVAATADGWELTLAVDGLQCGACVWLIESVLACEPGLQSGRINMSSRRLRLT